MKGSDAVGLGKYRWYVVAYGCVACVHDFSCGAISEDLLFSDAVLHCCTRAFFFCKITRPSSLFEL